MVYKYFSPDRVSFLSDQYISFSPPSMLNDPTECKPIISLNDINRHIDILVERNFLKVIQQYGDTFEAHKRIKYASDRMRQKYQQNPEMLTGRILDTYAKYINANIGILSLSKTRDNELLWAHYCLSHEGFAVGFDENNEFFKKRPKDPKDCGFLRDVEYTNDRVTIDVDNIVVPLELIFTKKLDWAYEQEVRMMRALETADKVIDVGNTKIFLFKVPKSAIKEIIFGAKSSQALIDSILHTIKADKEYADVIFFRAEYNVDLDLEIVDFI